MNTTTRDALLLEAAQLFRHYESLHRAKGPGHEEKVARNADIAARIEAALSAQPAASVQGASDHSALLAELDEFVHGLDFMGTGGIETEKATEKEWQELLASVTNALNAAPTPMSVSRKALDQRCDEAGIPRAGIARTRVVAVLRALGIEVTP